MNTTGRRCQTQRACARAAAIALLAGAATAVHADLQSDRAQLEQKMALVNRLLSDSAAAERVSASGNRPAVGHLNEGRVHQALAADLLARGDLEGARRAADDALRHLSLARRMVPDPITRATAARQRNEQLLVSIERLLEAWRERSATSAKGGGDDMAAALGLVEVARRLARDGYHEESNRSLVQAERHLLSGLNRTLHAVTLDYTLRASNAAEAFEHELARQRALADLLPLAVRDLHPQPDALALIERYAQTSQALQDQALQQQRAGDPTRALELVRNATLYLQRALTAAGLVAPSSNESPP